MGYIYKITNLLNGKIYIGKTNKTIKERFQQHKANIENYSNRHLYNAMKCYGYSNFQIEAIEEVKNANELDDKEKYWIHVFNSANPEKGYNMTDGGEGGNTWKNNPHKQQTGELIRQAHLKEKYYPLTKENLEEDIRNNLLAEEMREKYHCGGQTLANRFKIYFGKTLNEIRPLKNSGQFKKKEVDMNSLLQDIYNKMSTPDLVKKYNISEKTIRNRCKETFGKNLLELRKEAANKHD